MRSNRLEELFHVLKSIRATVDQTHDLAERAIKETASDRELAESLRLVRHDFIDPGPDDIVNGTRSACASLPIGRWQRSGRRTRSFARGSGSPPFGARARSPRGCTGSP